MRSGKNKILLAGLVAVVACALWMSGLHEAVTFDRISAERALLRDFVEEHYILSVLVLLLLTVSTAFFVPGAIVFTVTAGFLFGTIPGALFAATGLTLGAMTAFLAARYLVGEWVQEKYRVLLATFNEEMRRHGHYYLLTLRVVPVLPFFLVNILAGMTEITLKRFTVVTSLGLMPGTFVYSFAGRKLGSINGPGDILSPGIIAALLLLAVLILLPVILKTFDRMRKKNRPASGSDLP